MPNTDAEQTALDRMTRTMYFAIGIATIIFGMLLAPSKAGFGGQMGQVDSNFMKFSIFIVLLVPATFPILARLLPLTAMRGLVTAVGIGFVSCQLLFPIALNGDTLESHSAPWLQGFGPIPATLIAVAWGGRITWVFALSQGPIVMFVALATRDDTTIRAILDGIGATVSC